MTLFLDHEFEQEATTIQAVIVITSSGLSGKERKPQNRSVPEKIFRAA